MHVQQKKRVRNKLKNNCDKKIEENILEQEKNNKSLERKI
jgi:hypothetical protein